MMLPMAHRLRCESVSTTVSLTMPVAISWSM